MARLQLKRVHDGGVQRRRGHVEAVAFDWCWVLGATFDTSDRRGLERRGQELAARQAQEKKLELAAHGDVVDENLDEEGVGGVAHKSVGEADLFVGATLLSGGLGAALVATRETALTEAFDEGVDGRELETFCGIRAEVGATERASGISLLRVRPAF